MNQPLLCTSAILLLVASPKQAYSDSVQTTVYYSRYRIHAHLVPSECARVGGFPAKVDTPAKFDFIASRIKHMMSFHSGVVIGLNDSEVEGEYRWYDGTLAQWTHWANGEPSNADGSNCGYLQANGFSIRSCEIGFYFTCEVQEGSPEAIQYQDVLSCWVANDLLRPLREREVDSERPVKCPRNKIYFSPSHRLNSKTWSEADSVCKQANGLLAKVTTEVEQGILDRFRSVKLFTVVWIGGTDVSVEGEYRWADGENFTWPDFLTVSKPADDTSKNCLVTKLTAQWNAASCTNQYPVLCEMDVVQRPKGEVCLWSLPKNKWVSLVPACRAKAGKLVMFKDVLQFERAAPILHSLGETFIGSQVTTKVPDAEFPWVDGSIMTWSGWFSGQPNQHFNNDPYVRTVPKLGFADSGGSTKYYGLCEKPVATFPNADVLHADGSINVVCHQFCRFADGTQSQTWTCGEQLPQEHEGCFCEEGGWSIQEDWLSYHNVSILSDNDNKTCLDLADIRSFFTLHYETNLRYTILVKVELPENLQSYLPDIVNVFTSEKDSGLGNTCAQQHQQLRKCQHREDNSFFCFCKDHCRLFLKIHQITGSIPLSVCEVNILG